MTWPGFTERLSSFAALDPDSERIVSLLSDPVVYGRPPGVSISGYTTPVYRATSRTSRVDVRIRNGLRIRNVPVAKAWRAKAAASPGSDNHLCILDEANGVEYDFYRWAESGALTAGNAVAVRIGHGTGWIEGGLGCRSAGCALTAGLILPEELASGEIRHALTMATPGALRDGTVPPADGGVGWSGGTHLLADGARLRLKESYDVDLIPDPALRVVARAAQAYGVFTVDGGGAYFYAQDVVSGAKYPASWQGKAVVPFPKGLWAEFEVLMQGDRWVPAKHRNGADAPVDLSPVVKADGSLA